MWWQTVKAHKTIIENVPTQQLTSYSENKHVKIHTSQTIRTR